MICFNKITELFCITDEFCKNFEKTTESFIIGNKPKRKPRMSTAEVITIYYLFHLGGFRCFKNIFTFLRTKTHAERFSKYRFIQPICRADAIYFAAHDYVCKNLLFR